MTPTDGHIAIIGTGLIGAGCAVVFARAGWTVRLFDRKLGAAEVAVRLVTEAAADLAEAGLIDTVVATAISARVFCAADLEACVENAVDVQESVPEKLDVKRAVFAALYPLVGPDCLIGPPTSSMPASVYTDHVACRARALLAHPVNPPHLVPLVEIVQAPWTEPESIQAVRGLLAAFGQAPIVLSREIEGFVLDRLQGVLLNEWWRLFHDGIASTDDVDTTIREGLGLRWSSMAPFETIDLNAPRGVDHAERLSPIYADIDRSRKERDSNWPRKAVCNAEAERRKLLRAEQLKARSLWRDRRLIALARHK